MTQLNDIKIAPRRKAVSAFAALGLAALVATPVFAGPKTKVLILFKDFPMGTQCSVDGAVGKVKLGTRKGSPTVQVKGNGEVGTYFCVLPDGRRIVTDVNMRLIETSKSVGVTVYPDGRAFATISTTDGQLLSQEFSGTVK